MKISKKDFINLLIELFEVPSAPEDSLDLSQYIKDSIDVGELLSVLKIRYQIDIDPNDIQAVTKLGDVWDIVKAKS